MFASKKDAKRWIIKIRKWYLATDQALCKRALYNERLPPLLRVHEDVGVTRNGQMLCRWLNEWLLHILWVLKVEVWPFFTKLGQCNWSPDT